MKPMKLVATIAFLALASTAAAQDAKPTWLVRRAKAATPPAFDTLTIGKTTREEAVAALDAPSGQKDRVQGWQKTDACRNYGLYSIAARYDENDIIEELELILARPLEPWIVESDLRLDRPTERTDASRNPSAPAERLIYADAGVRLLVARERVVAIQLFAPTDVPAADLRRRIRVNDLQCRTGSFDRGRMGIAVSGIVRTDGWAKQNITATVRLRTRDGRPIPATGSTQPYRVSAQERTEFEWSNRFFVELFVPYQSLDRQAASRGPVILTLDAECAGLFSCAEMMIALPPARNPLVLPQIRIAEQRLTASPEHIQIVAETDRLDRQTMTAKLSVRGAGTGGTRDVGSAQAETDREFGDVRDFKIALDGKSTAVSGKPLVLRSTVECGGLRAVAEMECVFMPIVDGNGDGDIEKGPTYSIEVIQPAGEMLAHPYTDRLDSRPHTVPFEVKVQGLPPGLRSLRLSIDGAGERTLWSQVAGDKTAAVFKGEVPLPPGPYRITLSLPDSTATQPITLEGKLPGYPYAPTKEDLDEWIAYVAGWQERNKDAAVAWGLCNLGRDYYLLGMLDKAQESLDRAMVIYDRGGENPERLRNACRILAQTHLLRGDVAAMNAACERWMQSEPTDDELARFTFEWAESRALLDSDPSAARRLWEDTVRHASAAGTEIPPAPPWANEQPK